MDSKNTRGEPGAAAGQRSNARRFLLVFGLIFCAVAAFPAWHSGRLWWHTSHAEQLLNANEPAAAIESLNKAAVIEPSDAKVQFLLAVAERRAGHLTAVKEHLERARNLGWPEDLVEFQRILTEVQAGNIDLQDNDLDKFLTRDLPDDIIEQAYEAFTIGYLATQRLPDAVDVLDKWAKFNPKAAAPHLYQGKLAESLQNTENAKTHFEKALELMPECHEARWKLAEIALAANDVTGAKAAFERCQAAVPNRPEVLLGLAQCARRSGSKSESKQFLETVIESRPPPELQARALLELGQLALDSKNASLAIEHLQNCLRLNPNYADALYNLGVAYGQKGEEARSRELIDKSQQIRELVRQRAKVETQLLKEPDNIPLLVEQAELFSQTDDLRNAVALMTLVLRKDPENHRAHLLLAGWFKLLGDAEQAAYHEAYAAKTAPKAPAGPMLPPGEGRGPGT